MQGSTFVRPLDRPGLLDARTDRVRYLDVPPILFAMIDGHGAPTPELIAPRIGLLYPLAYGLHFALKRRGILARVPPLEGLYWANDPKRPIDLASADRGSWSWTLLLALPDDATTDEIDAATADARRKRPSPLWEELRVERFAEGASAQILHVGPYADEGPTLARLHAAIAADGLMARGRHHEIYLGDPRRARPDRLRTIIRQPVAPA